MNRRLSQAMSVLMSIKNLKTHNENTVLLLLPMGLGDAVMFLGTIDYYFESFKESNKIVLVSTSVADKVFKFARPNLEYEFIEYNPMKMDTDTEYFMGYLNRLGKIKYNTIVYPLRGFLTMDLLFGKLSAGRKITIDTIKAGSQKNAKIKLRDKLIKHSTIVRFQPNDMDLIRYARVAERVCNKSIKARLPRMEIEKKMVDRMYCQISVGSSRPEKCWPSDRFAKVAEYILLNTSYDLVFTGSKEDRLTVDELTKELEPKDRIINRCGDTSLEELFEITGNAKILIGGDSGPIHVAVALNVTAICIVGGWDYERVYPYKVEMKEEGRIAPISVNTGVKECYRCLLLHGRRGATNENCSSKIKAGKACLCIDDIPAKLVIETLRSKI